MRIPNGYRQRTKKKYDIMKSFINVLAWLFLWLTRIMIGNLAIAFFTFLIYRACVDWPIPLYAVGIIAALALPTALIVWLYALCEKRLNEQSPTESVSNESDE